MYSIGFILALLVFGGLAAYLGDVLGYRLGKRRLSLLRLRPRTTARLVGILAGVLIPAVTMTVGAIFIPGVRDALLRIDYIRRELVSLQGEVRTSRAQSEALKLERDAALDEAEEAEEQRLGREDELGETRARLTDAKGKVEAAQARVAGLQSRSAVLSGDLDQTQDALKDAHVALDEAHVSLDDVQLKLDAANARKDLADKDAEAARAEAEKLRRDVVTLGDSLARVRAEWEAALDIALGQPAALDLGAELVRGVVERPASADALTDDVVRMLWLADEVAEASGAGRGENERFVRVIWAIPTDLGPEAFNQVRESRILGRFVRMLWGSDVESHVIRAVVYRRTLPGEQVNIGFVAIPNELLFREGQPVVARELRRGIDAADAFEQLWSLIADPERSEVRKQAQDAGMLPKPGAGGYGAIPVREIYDAAEECAGRDGPVTVRIEAAADAHTVGPLAVRIVVDPDGG